MARNPLNLFRITNANVDQVNREFDLVRRATGTLADQIDTVATTVARLIATGGASAAAGYDQIKDHLGTLLAKRRNLKVSADFAVGDADPDTNLALSSTGVSAGSYTSSNITVDAKGRVTAASNGSGGGVTAVTATSPLTSSGGATPDISLDDTAVTPGSYTNTNLTVDAKGRITAASNGSGGGGGTGNTIDDALKARAQALVFPSGQPVYWSDPFMVTPGSPGSPWRDGHGVDIHVVSDLPGGVVQVFSNAGYGNAYVDPEGSYPSAVTNRLSFFGDTTSTPPLYMAWRICLQDPGGGWALGAHSMILGVVDPHTLQVAGVGVGISGASSHFGAVGGNVSSASATTGIDSTVAVDFNVWHLLELYTASGKWWLKVDDGTAIDVSALYTSLSANCGLPLMQIMSTNAAAPSVYVDHVGFASAGNGSDISPTPSP